MFIESANTFQFNFTKSNKNIRTVYQNKIIQNTAVLKRFIKNNRTYPYGYTGEFFSQKDLEVIYVMTGVREISGKLCHHKVSGYGSTQDTFKQA